MDAARSTSASKKERLLDSHSLFRRLAVRVFDDLAAMGVKDEDGRAALRTLALAEVRRPTAWLLPGAVCLIAVSVLAVFWLLPDKPWRDPQGILVQVLGIDVLLGLTILLVATFQFSAVRGVGQRLEEIALTGMIPRLIALSSVSGRVAVWGFCCGFLAIVQSLLIGIRLVCPGDGMSPSFSLWQVPARVVCAVLTGAAVAWFYLETIRLILWGSTAFLLHWPKERQSWRSAVQTMLGHFLGGAAFAGLLFFLIYMVGVEAWAPAGPARIRAGTTPVPPLVQLFLCTLAALPLSLFLRQMARIGIRYFDLGWHSMDWRGLAEPEAPMPEHFRAAFREWSRYLWARDATEAKRDNDFLTRWKARSRCAQYRWFRANTSELAPDSHRFVGWDGFRREFLEPDDDLALEPPAVPLPFEPNPDRAFGTPVGGPSVLESPRGSFVSSLRPASWAFYDWVTRERLRLPILGCRIGQFGFFLCGILLAADLVALAASTNGHPFSGYLPLRPPWNPTGSQPIMDPIATMAWGGAFLATLCPVFLGFCIGARWWKRRQFARVPADWADRVGFNMAYERPLVLGEGRTFSLPAIVPPCRGFLRVTPGFLEIEAERFHARLRSDEVRLQVQESDVNCALLVSTDFDGVTWAVSVHPPMTWKRFLSLPSTRRFVRRWRDELKREMQISEYPNLATTPCRSCGR